MTTTVTELAAEYEIRRALTRYCRGVDRGDPAQIEDVFLPGAVVRYGPLVGNGGDLARRIVGTMNTVAIVGQHHITNIYVEFHGAVAAVESYFLVLRPTRLEDGEDVLVQLGGRYLDRFEDIDGVWKIAARTVIRDWISDTVIPRSLITRGPNYPSGKIGPADPSHAFFAGCRPATETTVQRK